MAKNLWQKGQQYYFKINVPRPLRQHFLSERGNPVDAIWKPLGPDQTPAKIEAARLLGAYELIFARLKAGEIMTAEQIQADLAVDVASIQRQTHEDIRAYYESMLPVIARRVDAEKDAAARARGMTAIAFYRQLLGSAAQPEPVTIEPAKGETISQAAEAWYQAMQADPSAAVKQTTLAGHKLRVGAFIEHAGDIPLGDVTRAMAADFLAKVAGGRANRTTNTYATTLSGVFKSATHRGLFTGNNPFDGQKRKVGGESYEAFETAELQKLFDSFKFEVAPKHSPESALPWVALVAAYTGMRLEEIAQLKTSDVRDQGSNGSIVTIIDIHNGGNNSLKNESSARLVPVHSQLVRAGFLDYVKALPQDGPLFPGLTRRASKGGKIGARLGELFRKRLEALGMKRDRPCFHSFRHTVAEALEAAAVSQTDAARVLGHTIPGMSYGVYSSGPGLKRLAAVVEEIAYPGLKLPGTDRQPYLEIMHQRGYRTPWRGCQSGGFGASEQAFGRR